MFGIYGSKKKALAKVKEMELILSSSSKEFQELVKKESTVKKNYGSDLNENRNLYEENNRRQRKKYSYI